MDGSLEELIKVNPLLAKVVDGQNLSADESLQLFKTIFLNDEEGYHLAILLGAIHAKGETSDELLGLINTYKELTDKLNINASVDKITDLSSTGGGSFKTINVGTAASFIVAAVGYTVPKASYYSITSPTGSADIFAAFGIEIAKLSKDKIEDTLNEIGICPYFTPFINQKLANRGKLSRKLFGERKIQVRTPFHLTTNAFSPFSINHRIYGCYSKKYILTLVELFQKMGFKRSLVFSAEIGLAEISNVGKTYVVEQNGAKIKEYILTPEELGLQIGAKESIATGGKEQNILDFINILKGKEKGPKADLIAANAGASLYSLEDVVTIKEGVKKAKEILNSGTPYKLLEKLVKKIGSPEMLQTFSASRL